MRQQRWIIVALALAFVLGIGGLAQGESAAAPPGEKFDLTGAIADKEDALQEAMTEAGTGDNKTFAITTDDDISALKAGDIYTSGEKTLFKVVSVEAYGTKGGSFVLLRAHGTADPDRRFTRVQGLGPLTIVKRMRLIDFYWAAGWPAHFITLLAIAGILLTANCVWLYRRGRQCPARFVEEGRRRLDAGDVAGLEELSLKTGGLFPRICRALTERLESSTAHDIRARVDIVAGAQVNRLRIPVKALNFIAVCAPLIGLAGTIYGMIIVFEAVAGATGASKAAVMAGGIRLKLLCTLFALMVAVPALTLFFIFSARMGTVIAECEMLAEEFMHRVLVLRRRQVALAGGGSVDEEEAEEDEAADEEPAPPAPKPRKTKEA